MSELLKAILLGIIQGLAEFLPVSSSGHLELGKVLLGFEAAAEDSLMFTVIVHAGTVLSTMVVFRKVIWDIVRGFFKFEWNAETRFVVYVLVSIIPVGIVYVFFKDPLEALFNGNILLVGCMLIITGGLLFLTRYAQALRVEEGEPVKLHTAFIIGIAQAAAVLPGISRSGSTISTGLLLGVDKEKIAGFSFLMVLPPIIGATLLDVKDVVEKVNAVGVDQAITISPLALVVGFIAAFVTGVLACTWMIRIVKRGKLQWFAYYCFAVGLVCIVASLAME